MPDSTDTPVKILGFNGSLREGSYSMAVLRTLAEKGADKAQIDIFPLNDIPLYNEDLDVDGVRPAVVDKFKSAIAAADGLVVVSPEYNYGITGVLKNAIDWASRPGYNSVLKHKPILLIGSSIAFTGGVRALDQLKQTLGATLSRVVPVPDILIGGVQNKIQDGRLMDEVTLSYLLGGLDSLIADVKMSKHY